MKLCWQNFPCKVEPGFEMMQQEDRAFGNNTDTAILGSNAILRARSRMNEMLWLPDYSTPLIRQL
jgi:hypothetical protein